MFDHESAVADAGGKTEPMSKPSSARLRCKTQLAVFGVFLLMIGTGSAQVTWPTLPAGFRAATNDVSVINYTPLPDWARRVIDENNIELLAESLRAISDATNAAALNQRVFYYAVSANALKVAEWCLVNGASVGTMAIGGSWKGNWVQPLAIAIRSTNAPMVRLLIAAGASPAPILRSGKETNKISHYFPSGAEAALGFLLRLSHPPYHAVIPGPSDAMEVAGLLVQGGVDPFVYHNGYSPIIFEVAGLQLWHLGDTLMTNQPLAALRSERGTVTLHFALDHRRTNVVEFLRSIPVPEK